MKNIKFILILTTLIFFSACVNSATQKETTKEIEKEVTKEVEKEENTKEKGEIAPKFELVKTDGGKVSRESLKGNPAVLVFWASYCGKCKKETPSINRLAEDFKSKGVQVVGVNYGEEDSKIKEGMESFGIKYAVAKDSDKKVGEAFEVKGTPTIVFLDKKGSVKYKGNKLPKDYAKQLNALSRAS